MVNRTNPKFEIQAFAESMELTPSSQTKVRELSPVVQLGGFEPDIKMPAEMSSRKSEREFYLLYTMLGANGLEPLTSVLSLVSKPPEIIGSPPIFLY